MQAADQPAQAMLGGAIAAPVRLPHPLRGIHGKHQCRVFALAQQRQAGLGQPGRSGQGDVHGSGETGRVGQLERGQAGKVRCTDQQAIKTSQLLCHGLGQFGIIVGTCTFQVQRVQQGFRPDRLHLGIDPVQPAWLAPQQDHGRSRLGGSHSGGTPQPTTGAGNKHHAILQRAAIERPVYR
ncbi:hypothetical protein D3C72_1426980 [compost metagenome]